MVNIKNMKFKIVKDFNQIDKDYQDKVKGTQGWEYVDDDGLTKVVEPNTCYFIKAYDDFGKFNVAISDDNKEVRFLFHNINIDNWQDEDDEYNFIFKIKIEDWNETFINKNDISKLHFQQSFDADKIDFGNGRILTNVKYKRGSTEHFYEPGEYVVKMKIKNINTSFGLDFSKCNITEIIKFPFDEFFKNNISRSLNFSNNKIPKNGFVKILTGLLKFSEIIKTARKFGPQLNTTYTPIFINISGQFGYFGKANAVNSVPFLKQDPSLKPEIYFDPLIEERRRSQEELDLMTQLFELGYDTRCSLDNVYTINHPLYIEDQLKSSIYGSAEFGVEPVHVVPCIENVGDSSVKDDNIFFVVGVNDFNGYWTRRLNDQNNIRHISRQNVYFHLFVEKEYRGGSKEFIYINSYKLRNDRNLKNVKNSNGITSNLGKNVVEYLDVNLETLKNDLRAKAITWEPRVPGSAPEQGRLKMKFISHLYNVQSNGTIIPKKVSSNPGLVGANTQHLQEYKDLNIISQDGLLAEYERLQAVEYAS